MAPPDGATTAHCGMLQSIRTARPGLAGKTRRSAVRPRRSIGRLAVSWSASWTLSSAATMEQDMKVTAIGTLGLALVCLAVPAFAQASNGYCQGKSLTLVVG